MILDFENTVDIIENIDADTFNEKYLKKEIPVVLRGLWNDYPAIHKWSIQYFKDNLGDINVGVFDEGKADRSFKKPEKYMKFGDYLDLIASGPTDLRLFLFDILKYKPGLKQDFDFPPITKRYLKKFPFMFFGGKNAVVRMHQDMDFANVFLTQLHGRKYVVLFPPSYSTFLYRYPFNVHSPVKIENPDYDKYPGLRFVKGMKCILEPGDTLFIPSGYWHYIKYLEGGYAINQRALSPHFKRVINGMWHVIALSNIDDLMRWGFGDKWFAYKQKAALRRAARMMTKMNLQNQK